MHGKCGKVEVLICKSFIPNHKFHNKLFLNALRTFLFTLLS